MYKEYAKAFVAILITALGSIQVALPDGVDLREWIGIVIAALIAGSAVAWTPNATDTP